MNPKDLRKGDMIMIPRKGELPTRNVLLLQCEEIEVDESIENYYLDDNDWVVIDPSTGESLYWVIYLDENQQIQETLLRPSQITLIARRGSFAKD